MKVRFLLVLVILLASGLWAQDLSQPSKKELYQRARDAMKTALESGDYDRAGQALDYLKENVKNGAPLNRFEEHLANMELNRFEDGILLYGDIRHVFLDPEYKVADSRVSVDDQLNRYLFRNFMPFTRRTVDSLYARAEASDVKREYKDLYKTLLYSELVIGFNTVRVGRASYMYHVISDTTDAEDFLVAAKHFTESYPLSEHSVYLKKNAIPFVENYMTEVREFRRDPISKKYYTGGVDAYVGSWIGFASGGISDVSKTEMDTPFQLEVQLRFRRFSLGAFIDHGLAVKPNFKYENKYMGCYNGEVAGDEMLGVTFGFTAYDSHYLRVEPFFGVGESYMEGFEDYWISPLWIFGANADYRFYATHPKHPTGMSLAFMLRFKYKASVGSAESTVINGGVKNPSYGAVYHSFGLSLGVNIW